MHHHRNVFWRYGFLTFALSAFLLGTGCGDSDDDPRTETLPQLGSGFEGAWVRTGPCPLESAEFCPFYQETVEIDASLIRGTLYLGAQNRTLATATYRILDEGRIEARDIATNQVRTARYTVDAANLRVCAELVPSECADFRRVASLPPRTTGNHALPPLDRVVYEFSIDDASTTVEAVGPAGQAIFPSTYGEVLPKLHSQSLVQAGPGELYYANIESVLVGPDPERVEDYRFHVEILRTARDRNVVLGQTVGAVVLTPGVALEIPGSEGTRRFRLRITLR